MSATTSTSPVTGAIAGELKKKRVLLVDTSRTKRDLRAEVMRRLGMEVDCAADIPEARAWWKADLYDLVLINVERLLLEPISGCDWPAKILTSDFLANAGRGT